MTDEYTGGPVSDGGLDPRDRPAPAAPSSVGTAALPLPAINRDALAALVVRHLRREAHSTDGTPGVNVRSALCAAPDAPEWLVRYLVLTGEQHEWVRLVRRGAPLAPELQHHILDGCRTRDPRFAHEADLRLGLAQHADLAPSVAARLADECRLGQPDSEWGAVAQRLFVHPATPPVVRLRLLSGYARPWYPEELAAGQAMLAATPADAWAAVTDAEWEGLLTNWSSMVREWTVLYGVPHRRATAAAPTAPPPPARDRAAGARVRPPGRAR